MSKSLSNPPFRLLDLPPELRARIYKEVFSGSSIMIKSRLKFQPAKTVDDLLKHIDLRNYASALTFTSHQIRRESGHFLDRATTLIFRGGVIRTLHSHLQTCPAPLLRRITRIRFLALQHRSFEINTHLRNIISTLPTLTTVECAINLVASRRSPHEALQLIDDVNRRAELGLTGELDLDDDRDAVLEEIMSIEAFARHAAVWTREVLPFDFMGWRMKTAVVAPFFAPAEVGEHLIDEREGAQPTSRVSMFENKYGLVTWDGRELRSRELEEEEAFDPDYHKIMAGME